MSLSPSSRNAQYMVRIYIYPPRLLSFVGRPAPLTPLPEIVSSWRFVRINNQTFCSDDLLGNRDSPTCWPHKSGENSTSTLLDAHIPVLRSPFPDYATNTAQVPFCSVEEASQQLWTFQLRFSDFQKQVLKDLKMVDFNRNHDGLEGP